VVGLGGGGLAAQNSLREGAQGPSHSGGYALVAIAPYVSPEAARILYIDAAAHPPEIGMSTVLTPFGYLGEPPPLAAKIRSS